MHCHLIVSRKDQVNKKKLSLLTNHKNTKKEIIKDGFNLKRKSTADCNRQCFFFSIRLNRGDFLRGHHQFYLHRQVWYPLPLLEVQSIPTVPYPPTHGYRCRRWFVCVRRWTARALLVFVSRNWNQPGLSLPLCQVRSGSSPAPWYVRFSPATCVHHAGYTAQYRLHVRIAYCGDFRQVFCDGFRFYGFPLYDGVGVIYARPLTECFLPKWRILLCS